MKYIIIFLLFPFSLFSQKTLTIISEDTIEIIIFQDSKMIHHHIMNPGDELTLDKSSPLLIQAKPLGYYANETDLDWVKINEYGYFEVYFDHDLDMRLTPWWARSVKALNIKKIKKPKKVIPRA